MKNVVTLGAVTHTHTRDIWLIINKNNYNNKIRDS